MKKKIEKKVISPLGSWAAILTVCLCCIFLQIGAPNVMSALILSTFVLLPARHYTFKFIVWAIEFSSSNNEKLKLRIKPWATMEVFLEETKEKEEETKEKKPPKRVKNPGFYLALQIVLWLIFGFTAVIFWVFQDFAAGILFISCHTVATLFGNLIFGSGWERASVFIWILSTIAFFAIVGWFISTILRGKLKIPKDLIVLGISMVVHKAMTYWLLEFTWNMIGIDFLGSLIPILVVVLIIFGLPLLWKKFLKNIFH